MPQNKKHDQALNVYWAMEHPAWPTTGVQSNEDLMQNMRNEESLGT